jgi:hypothetical protein
MAKKVGERQRHTVRAVHAKSHGLLKAEVTVVSGLMVIISSGPSMVEWSNGRGQWTLR